MQPTESNQSALVIAGMHRSGTSLTASLLQKAGVNVGERLLGPGCGNVKGHFENLDFVEFHQAVLQSQGIDPGGWTLQPELEIEIQYIEQAKELINQYPKDSIWGWKDPRTTLFLDFWASLLPNAHFLLVYRAPWEVADSLYRRTSESKEIFTTYPDLALKTWIHYNKKVLQFYHKLGDRCLLLNIDTITSRTEEVFREINHKFKLELTLPPSDIYDPSLLRRSNSDAHRATLTGYYFPEAINVYKDLCIHESLTSDGSNLEWLTQIKSAPYRVWAFQDWVTVRYLETQNRTLQTNLREQQQQVQQLVQQTQTQSQQFQQALQQTQEQQQDAQTELQHSQATLQQTQAELQHSQTALQQTQAELQHSQTTLQQTQAELQHSQTTLQQAQVELQQTRVELQQTQVELQQARVELQQANLSIIEIHSSKLWKLKNSWFKLRKKLEDLLKFG